MPRLAELRNRFQISLQNESTLETESFVSDPRNGLTPQQVVDGKFGRALQEHCDLEKAAMIGDQDFESASLRRPR